MLNFQTKRTKMRTKLIIGLMAASLLITGCGSSDDDGVAANNSGTVLPTDAETNGDAGDGTDGDTNNGTGRITSSSTYLNTVTKTDNNADSIVDIIEIITYDANGNMLVMSLDSDADGTANSISTYTYSNNALQSMITKDSIGSTTSSSTYTYDSNGNLSKISFDSDGNGIFDNYYNYIFDANGNQEFTSYEANGIVLSSTTIVYDTNGNPLSIYTDSDGNNIPNYTENNVYDANGNRSISTISFYENSTSPSTFYFSDYDANGNAQTVNSDKSGSLVTFTYTYNTYGDRMTEFLDLNADGSLDQKWFYTYDVQGALVKTEFDNGNDGIDHTNYEPTTFIYDTNGNIIKESSDFDYDGTPDMIVERTWIKL